MPKCVTLLTPYNHPNRQTCYPILQRQKLKVTEFRKFAKHLTSSGSENWIQPVTGACALKDKAILSLWEAKTYCPDQHPGILNDCDYLSKSCKPLPQHKHLTLQTHIYTERCCRRLWNEKPYMGGTRSCHHCAPHLAYSGCWINEQVDWLHFKYPVTNWKAKSATGGKHFRLCIMPNSWLLLFSRIWALNRQLSKDLELAILSYSLSKSCLF